MNKKLEKGAGGRKPWAMRFKCNMKNCVAYKVLKQRGWMEVSDEYDWDVYWADVQSLNPDSGFDYCKIKEGAKINHFPRHNELTRKDLMAKNLKKSKRQHQKEGRHDQIDFFPQTYIIPQDYGLFAEDFKTTGGVWIAKPSGKSQGKGIFLVDKLSQITAWKRQNSDKENQEVFVVSRYIERPLLVGGRKFDIRIFVLVLSFSPLVVYIHRGGFCRFSSQRYSIQKDRKDLETHLTNIAIQKKAEGYEKQSGMKWPLKSLKLYLITKYGVNIVTKLFSDIQNVVIRSLQAVQQVVTQDKHCFELYGYDILIDENFKPWLVEVNASPSLVPDTDDDYQLKYSVVDQAINLVDVDQKYKTLPTNYGGFDLLYNTQGPVYVHVSLPSLLGCHVHNPIPIPDRRKKVKDGEGGYEVGGLRGSYGRNWKVGSGTKAKKAGIGVNNARVNHAASIIESNE